MTASTEWGGATLGGAEGLGDREALERLIEYARVEALRSDETLCAELLSAASIALQVARRRDEKDDVVITFPERMAS